jgi:hypothetical protein
MKLVARVKQEGLLASLWILFWWKLAMPAREAIHKHRCRRRDNAAHGKLHSEHLASSEVTASYSPYFYLSKSDQETLAKRIQRDDPDAIEACITRAESILAGEYQWLLHGWINTGSGPDWLSLVDKPGSWEAIASTDLDFMTENRSGDIRRIWELNRHQHWITLGRAWRLTGDRRYAAEFTRQLADWLVKNPPGKGPNWVQAQETALRMISWTWAWHLFHDAAEFTIDLRKAMLQSLERHFRFTERHLCAFGRYTHNHLISELSGLYLVSRFFPFLQDAARTEKWTRALIVREVKKQIYEDGIAAELSTNYMLFVLDSLTGVVAADPVYFKKWGIWERVSQMGNAAARLVRPDGSLPYIGDNDSGRGWRLSENDHDRSIYGQLPSVMEGAQTESWLSMKPAQEWLWIFGPDLGTASYSAFQPARMFESGGIWTWRSDASPKASWVLFRGGATLRKTGVLQSHHHADALSFELVFAGQSVLIDPGTYAYSLETTIRQQLRSSKAHSTLWVENREQCDFRGKRFGVWDLPTSRLIDLGLNHLEMAVAWKDVDHTRRLLVDDSSVTIVDFVRRPPQLDAEIGFQLAAGVDAVTRKSGWYLPEMNLSLRMDNPASGHTRGRIENAVVSQRYGQVTEAFRLVVNLPNVEECTSRFVFESGDTA